MHIRNLIQKPQDKLVTIIPKQRFTLTFDDSSVIETTYAQLFLSIPWLKVINKYPDTQITEDIYITSFTNHGLLSIAGMIRFASAIRKKILFTYSIFEGEPLNQLNRDITVARNDFYNTLSYLESFMSGGNISDFIEIHDVPEIKKRLRERKQDMNWVSSTHDFIMKTLIDAKKISPHNEIRKAILGRNVNQTQTLQCIGPRGVLTDVDGSIYPTIITRGYSEGLENLVFMALDSRMAAKALFLSDDMIRKAEYFARLLQVVCMELQNIEGEDCGSDNYLTWDVGGELNEDGSIKDYGTLPYIIGSYYLAEDGRLLSIKGDEKHLIGKTIQKRWVIGCKNQRRHTKCRRCVGDISYNFPVGSSMGLIAPTTMTIQTTQRVLSAKHKMGSTVESSPYLTDIGKKYFEFSEERYWLKNKGHQYLGIDMGQVNNLSMKNIDGQNTDIGNIDTVHLYEEDYKADGTRVRVTKTKGGLVFSEDFVKYINRTLIIQQNGMYIFDISKWNVLKPIFRLIPKEYGYHEHLADLKSLLFTLNIEGITTSRKPNYLLPEVGLQELYNRVNPDLHMNISLLEIIICALCVADLDNDDYRLPAGETTAKMVKIMDISRYRSLSLLYGFEKMTTPLYHPKTIGHILRDDHPYDVLIKPNDVLNS